MTSPNSTVASWLNFGDIDAGYRNTDDMDGDAFYQFRRFRSHVNEQYRKTYKTWGYVGTLSSSEYIEKRRS